MFKWKEESNISHFKSKAGNKLSEKVTWKAKAGQKLVFSHQTVSQVVNAKGMFLKEIKWLL